MNIERESAISIARRFVADHDYKVGEVCGVSHISKDDYKVNIRRDIGHGSWMVSFAYIGPPLTERQRGFSPALDSPTTIVINDETGDAEVMVLLWFGLRIIRRLTMRCSEPGLSVAVAIVASRVPGRWALVVRHLMNASLQKAVEKAIKALPKRHAFKTGSDEFELRTPFPVESWRPHTEPCRHADSVVIGEDSCGNFFLRAPDGSVSFWDHETDNETVLATSVEAFLAALIEPTPVVLQPGQVKKVWIDPAFLEELRRKGDA